MMDFMEVYILDSGNFKWSLAITSMLFILEKYFFSESAARIDMSIKYVYK